MEIIKQWINSRGDLDARLYISNNELYIDYNLCRETLLIRDENSNVVSLSSLVGVKQKYKIEIARYLGIDLVNCRKVG